MLELYLQTLKNQTESKMGTKTTVGLDAASVKIFHQGYWKLCWMGLWRMHTTAFTNVPLARAKE